MRKPTSAAAPGERNALTFAQTRSLLQNIVEAMPNAVLLVRQNGCIELANQRAARMFGYRAAELTGTAIEQLVPKRFRDVHQRVHAQFMREPGTREMGAGRELFGLRKDGTEMPIEVGLNALHIPGQTLVLASTYDASERQAAQRSANDATALAQSIIESAPFAIIATNLDGVILEVSPAAEQMSGYTRQQLCGLSAPSLMYDAGDPLLRRIAMPEPGARGTVVSGCADILRKLRRHEVDAREWRLETADGRTLAVHLAISGLHHRDGTLSGYLAIAQDITERKHHDEKIKHIAQHDALTNLPNRSLLRDRLDMAIAKARRTGKKVGVLLLDLDHFKRINDSLGHHLGDLLLVGVAARLVEAVRASDTVARMGGDEFVIVLPDQNSVQDSFDVAGKLVERIGMPMQIDGHRLQVSASIGVCHFPDDGADSDALLKEADTAMYAAKEAGRHRFVPFSPDMAKEAVARWTLEHQLQHALETGGFRMHYQPQVCLTSGRVLGAEALLRWVQDADAEQATERLIAIAEQTGQIVPIGEWAMRTACREIGELRARLPEDFRLAINLSPRQLRIDTLPTLVQHCLQSSGLPPQALELEITESTLLHDDILAPIQQLRALGVRVAIDDFGTGFSSLSHITHFPIDGLKIDRNFVKDINAERSQAAVSAAIIAIGKRLDLEVIAEGIETEAQRDTLLEQGCTRAQGFLFSPGVPCDQLLDVIARLARSPPADRGR